MKHVSRFLSLIILVSAGVFYVSCDGGEEPQKTQEELQLDKLKATWTLQSANDGTDRTDEYPGMTMIISGTYSAGGTYHYESSATSWPSVSPWKAVDDWKFESGNLNSIVRQSDLQEMAYTLSNGDKTLTISFNYQGPGFNNGRTESVTGDWDFVFTRP